jgi:hypothetical protein
VRDLLNHVSGKGWSAHPVPRNAHLPSFFPTVARRNMTAVHYAHRRRADQNQGLHYSHSSAQSLLKWLNGRQRRRGRIRKVRLDLAQVSAIRSFLLQSCKNANPVRLRAATCPFCCNARHDRRGYFFRTRPMGHLHRQCIGYLGVRKILVSSPGTAQCACGTAQCARMRNGRPLNSWSCTKSMLERSYGAFGTSLNALLEGYRVIDTTPTVIAPMPRIELG